MTLLLFAIKLIPYTHLYAKGWLKGDKYGGYYEQLLQAGGENAVAPGLGCWNASCGKHTCWTATPDSAGQRINRIKADGIMEVAMFRIVQQAGVDKMPQDWWWPALEQFRS